MRMLGSLQDHYKSFKSVSNEVVEIAKKHHIKISIKNGCIILHLGDETFIYGIRDGNQLHIAYHLLTGEILVYKHEQLNIASSFDLEHLCEY